MDAFLASSLRPATFGLVFSRVRQTLELAAYRRRFNTDPLTPVEI